MPAQPQSATALPARRKQEDRTREAKEKLLTATIDVFMRSGYSGLTTKEVARTAGLSNGALMHHYANKAELVVAATAAIYDEAIIRGQRVARSVEAGRKPIEGFIADCLSVYFDWPFIAALEAIVAARTDPELMARILPVMDHYRTSTNALWLDVFRDAGLTPKEARLVLNLTLNMIRGMAVNRMWQQDESHYRAYLKDWVKLVHERYPALAAKEG
ncbi:TetR/AcrR family transcriptional regulator [Pigmentiphaga litoralis]|uniref:TetR/AcrR family transcriptional regulator n=1 Tax=Pigmentiphaga litoralis TaxID=516702 RepID=UPI003B42BF56